MSTQPNSGPSSAALRGWLPFGAPGDPLVLHDGALRLTSKSGPLLRARGQVTLSWNHGPQLRWTALPLDEDLAWRRWRAQDGRQLRLKAQGLEGSGQVQQLTTGEGWSNRFDLGTPDAPLERVVAHWVNLPQLWPAIPVGDPVEAATGSMQQALRWNAQIRGWDIRVDSRPDLTDVLGTCGHERTFAVTAVMEVRRVDGGLFTGAAADHLLHALQLAVSFALGRWSCPAVPVGYGPNGRAAWSVWGPLHCDYPGLGSSWWRQHRGQDLVETIEGFLRHQEDEDRWQTLKFTATSAIVANGKGFTEQRLITLTAALEHLCWVTQELGADIPEGDKRQRNGTAHSRVRRLLSEMRAERAVPGEYLPVLARYAKEQGGWDGPQAVSEVRNRLVHPKDTRTLYAEPSLVFEASALAARYLDLAVLHRIGFTGQFVDRANVNGWVGDVEPVPWVRS